MRFPMWLVVPMAVAGLIAGLFFCFRSIEGTFSTSDLTFGLCQTNDEIDPAQRDRIDSAAAAFLDFFEREPVLARQRMSRAGRSATPERAPLENAAVALSDAPVRSRFVSETYLVRFISGSPTGLRVPCGFREGRAAFVSRASTPFGAVVVFAEQMPRESQRATTVWLEFERGEWRVRAFHVGMSQILGLDAEELWAAARAQRADGKMFNAAMLYAASRSAQQRGTFYQVRMWQDFNADISTFPWPSPMNGNPPYLMHFGGETFSVTSLQYAGMESGELALIIDHAPPPWTTNEEADAINRRFQSGFDTAYPEWRELFDGMVVRAAKPGTNQRWGTVFMRDRLAESATPRAPVNEQ